MSRVVVFKTSQALCELRSLLFGTFEDQREGISKCKAYEVRGPLPPSVHTTCLLLAAIHGDVPSCDLYVIRQAYSMALIRFVNEILDAAQVGKSVVPLHALAVEANLPSAFVELRHAATHESLPSVYVLRDMAHRALSWLYDEYWVHQEGDREFSESSQMSDSTAGDAEDRIKELFREWRRLKRTNQDMTQVPADLLARLRRQLESDEPEFFNVVMNRNILVPAGTGPVKNRNVVVAMWMPLFLQLGSSFCTKLADRIVAELSAREWPPDSSENRKFPLLAVWAERVAQFISAEAVQLLGGLPRPWNARIIARYAVCNHRSDLFDIAEEMAAITGTELDCEYVPESGAPGWRIAQNWTPRPIGTW